MPTTKQPQDHKAPKSAPFTFKAGGKTYSLPNVDKGRAALSGRDFRDAVVGGEIAMMAYLFKALEAAKPAPAALEALYDLPQDKMLDVMNAWGEHGDGDGASLGE